MNLVRPEGAAISNLTCAVDQAALIFMISVPMMIVGGLMVVEEMIRDYRPKYPASLVTKIGLVAVFVGMCLFLIDF